jgi:broad specificity phosphatase PhoE
MDVDRILSSDLQRAAATAEAIAGSTGAPVEVRTLLRERSFGEWEGTDFGQVGHRTLEQAAQLGLSPLEVRPPGGESLFDVWDRLAPVEAELRGLSGTTVVSTHGGTLGLLLARLVNGTVATARSFRFGNTSITELERRPDGFLSIVRYNCVLHLDSMPSLAGSVDGTGR